MRTLSKTERPLGRVVSSWLGRCSVEPGRSRSRLAVVLVGTAIALAAVIGIWLGAAGAAPPTSVILAGPAANGDVDFATDDYATARDGIRDFPGATLTVELDIANLAPVTTENASFTFDDTEQTIEMTATGTVLGLVDSTVYLEAQWSTGGVDVSVVTTFDSFDLGDVHPGWADSAPGVDLAVGPAVVAVSNSDGTIDVAPLEAALGDIGTIETTADQVAFAGVVVGQAQTQMHQLGSAGPIVISGSFGTMAAGGGEFALPTGDFALAAEVPFEPDSLGFFTGATVGLATALEAGSPSFGATIEASFTPESSTSVNVELAAEFMPGAELNLAGNVSAIDDLFGQSWLDLTNAEFALNASPDSVALGIGAEVVIDANATTFTADFEYDGAEIVGSVEMGMAGSIEIAALASSFGVDAPSFGATLNTVNIALAFSGPTDPWLSVSASANATISINGGDIDVGVLIHFETGPNAQPAIFGVDVTTPNLNDLLGSDGFDWNLPDARLVVAGGDAAWDSADDLDAAMQAFFCPDDTADCHGLAVESGVSLWASAELPAAWREALAPLGFDLAADSAVEVYGQIGLWGSDTTSLEVSLPEIQTGTDSLVESATVSFFIEGDTTNFAAGITGDMVLRIARTENSAGCYAFSDGTCYDAVPLSVEVAIEATAGATPSVALTLTGTLAGGGSVWENAFGQDWLDIHRLSIQIGIEAKAGDVGLTTKFLGQLVLGTGSNTTDLTLAFALTATPNAPWIKPVGVTAASEGGVTIQQLASLVDLDADELPELGLKKLWFSYGIESDPDFCIMQGIRISAELHLGAPTGGTTPSCSADENPADSAPACSENTCIAGMLIDLNPAEKRFYGSAAFAGFEAGPVEVDRTEIELLLSPTTQRFAFEGGATLNDPTGVTDGEWASGSIRLLLAQDGGVVNAEIEAEGDLAGGYALSVNLYAAAELDLGALSNGDVIALFANSTWDVEFSLSSEALNELGEAVDQAIEGVKESVEDAVEAIETWHDDTRDLIERLDAVAVPTLVTELRQIRANMLGALDDIASAIDPYSSKIGISGQEVVAPFKAVINSTETIDELLLHGYTVTVFEEVDLFFFTLGPFRIDIEGYCDRHNHWICRPTRTEQYNEGLAPRYLTRIAASSVALPASDPGATFTQLDDSFVTQIAQPVCASTSGTWGPSGPSVPPMQMVYDAFGNGVPVELALDDIAAFADPAATQQVVDSVLADTEVPDGACREPAAPPSHLGGTSLTVSESTITEGTTITISGIAEGAGTLSVGFGDGTSTTVEIAAESQPWAIEHTYADDCRCLVTASMTEEGEAIAVVTVANADPQVTIAMSESSVFEGSEVTANISTSDAGVADEHYVVVDWGDGTTTELSLGTGRAASVAHVFVDDDPTATPSDVMSVSAEVVDDDRGEGAGETIVKVTNVIPTDFEVTSTTITPEATTLVISGEFTDVGVDDDHTLMFFPGDDTATSVGGIQAVTATVVADPVDPTRWTFEVEVIYPDDQPTNTLSDDYLGEFWLVDDDMAYVDETTGQFPWLVQPVTVTVTSVEPVLDLDAVGSVQYSDSIGDLVLTAVDTAGYPFSETPTETLTATVFHTVDGGPLVAGMPNGMSFEAGDPDSCGANEEPSIFDGNTMRCVWFGAGVADVAPGDYELIFEVVDDDNASSTLRHTMVVEPEDAIAHLISSTAVGTPANDGTVEMTLRATLADASAVDYTHPIWDEWPGDIRNATVSFVDADGGSVLCEATVNLMIDGNTQLGTAACDAVVDLDGADQVGFDLDVIVGGWYTNALTPTRIDMVVSGPTDAIATGGGNFDTPTSAGDFAEVAGESANGGWNAKYTKGNRNNPPAIAGNLNLKLVGPGNDKLQIKLVEFTSFAADAGMGEAQFEAWVEIAETGERAYLIAEVFDDGSPRSSADTIAVTVFGLSEHYGDGSTIEPLLYSSDWDLIVTRPAPFVSGNVQVR